MSFNNGIGRRVHSHSAYAKPLSPARSATPQNDVHDNPRVSLRSPSPLPVKRCGSINDISIDDDAKLLTVINTETAASKPQMRSSTPLIAHNKPSFDQQKQRLIISLNEEDDDDDYDDRSDRGEAGNKGLDNVLEGQYDGNSNSCSSPLSPTPKKAIRQRNDSFRVDGGPQQQQQQQQRRSVSMSLLNQEDEGNAFSTKIYVWGSGVCAFKSNANTNNADTGGVGTNSSDFNNSNSSIDADLPRNSCVLEPTLVRGLPKSINVFCVSVGAFHVLLATDLGVYSWGIGTHGALGHGNSFDVTDQPQRIEDLGPWDDSSSSSASSNNNTKGNSNSNSNSKKIYVIEVAAGGMHSLALDSVGNVYSFGYGANGELGLGSGSGSSSNNSNEQSQLGSTATTTTARTRGGGPTTMMITSSLSPVVIPYFRDNGIRIKGIACGWNHSIAVSESGELYSWGHGKFGQLGTGSLSNEFVPKLINISQKAPSKGLGDPLKEQQQQQQANGNGNSEKQQQKQPQQQQPVDEIAAQKMKNLKLASEASQKDVSKGVMKGSAAAGETADGATTTTTTTAMLRGYKVKRVACGRNHTMVQLENGDVYAWGHNNNGQCGFNPTMTTSAGANGNQQQQQQQLITTPKLIKTLRGKHVCAIACGSAHSVALTAFGEVLTWGFGNAGRLGHGDSKDTYVPTVVEALKGRKIVFVSAGPTAFHTLVLTETGDVMTWGSGKMGQLGVVTTTDPVDGSSKRAELLSNQKLPVKVESLSNIRLAAIGQRVSVAVRVTGSYKYGQGVPIATAMRPVFNDEDHPSVRPMSVGPINQLDSALEVVSAEYDTLSMEYRQLHATLRAKEKQIEEMRRKYEKVTAKQLDNMTLGDLAELERLYLGGIQKVAQAKQDAIAYELQRKEERLRLEMERKYKEYMAQVKARDQEALEEFNAEQKINQELQAKLQLLRADFEKGQQALQEKRELEAQFADLVNQGKQLQITVKAMQEKKVETENRLSSLRQDTEQLRITLHSLQEDYSRMIDDIGALRSQMMPPLEQKAKLGRLYNVLPQFAVTDAAKNPKFSAMLQSLNASESSSSSSSGSVVEAHLVMYYRGKVGSKRREELKRISDFHAQHLEAVLAEKERRRRKQQQE